MTAKKELSEWDIITQFIIPAIEKAGWLILLQSGVFSHSRQLKKGIISDTNGNGDKKRRSRINV
jgi:hypothetical protein